MLCWQVAVVPAVLPNRKHVLYVQLTSCVVGKPAEIAAAFDKIKEQMGHPEVLIYNAGPGGMSWPPPSNSTDPCTTVDYSQLQHLEFWRAHYLLICMFPVIILQCCAMIP